MPYGAIVRFRIFAPHLRHFIVDHLLSASSCDCRARLPASDKEQSDSFACQMTIPHRQGGRSRCDPVQERRTDAIHLTGEGDCYHEEAGKRAHYPDPLPSPSRERKDYPYGVGGRVSIGALAPRRYGFLLLTSPTALCAQKLRRKTYPLQLLYSRPLDAL
jgi:hypothetical protein